MRRLSHGMHHRQEALGQLVSLALADLIGLYRDQGVVTPFGLSRHRDASDRAGELSPAGLLLHLRQTAAKITGRAAKYVAGGEVGSVKVFHRVVQQRLRILIVFRIQVGNLLLPHQKPERVLEFDLLNEEVMLRIQPRRGLRALEIE